jgi:uncharacterized protein (TIGR02145 family)
MRRVQEYSLLVLLLLCSSVALAGTVTDIDGNVYQTVTIGTQEWMAENLKVTHYRNGEDIPNVTDGVTWGGLTTGAYCEFDNDVNNVVTYGRLYNWYAVDDSRNIAPSGWHVPTDAEWQTLVDYLGGAAVAGGKMKETGTTHWLSPNTGATNESGFSALPSGYRDFTGPYYNMSSFANYWSSTEDFSNYAWFRVLLYGYTDIYRVSLNEVHGFSVRCVRDDSDGDGVPDDIDNCPTVPNPLQEDLDSDALGDACDPDIDGDGLSNLEEAAIGSNPASLDSDGDGVGDYAEVFAEGGSVSNPADTDSDEIPNILDTDDEGDGIPTIAEDTNADGNPANDDTDSDGLPNYLDHDDDGDGVATLDEDVNADGNPANDDTDSDGLPNYLDYDDDEDGILTPLEDTNEDGNPANDDIDSDGQPNYLDYESDGDSVPDRVDNCPYVMNLDQSDADRDEIGDACDPDIDNDGLANAADNCPNVFNPLQEDSDSDAIGDACDNCPNIPNPGQEDTDADNIGDVCDGCCVGRVGDANGSGDDEPTIGDVSTMIDALFISGNTDVIACLAEADVNQSGGSTPMAKDITISDISMLIDYLFITGPSLGLLECRWGTVTDIDGNVYRTVTIGTQEWMAENLKVTHYRNGEAIPNVTDSTAWQVLSSGAYCNYDNNDNNVATYGRLYNWHAVTDSRNIAPAGWHVPTDAEWKQLEMTLAMSQAQADATGWRGSTEGGKLKESGTTHWWNPNAGATNENGFSALPGGYRFYYGKDHFMGFSTIYWSSTEYDTDLAWYRHLDYDRSVINHSYSSKGSGYQVRCVRDY